MDAQQRIDSILTAALAKTQEEVGVLIGADFKLASSQNTITTKKAFFETCTGKQVLARVDVSGDVEGVGAIVVGVRDAIRLGGVLIMLPSSELEECVGREEYSEEVADSFGEIANIISGSVTKAFEDMYPKPCRLVRKEQQLVLPAKGQADDDQSIPKQPYYHTQAGMILSGKNLGNLHLLLPAVAFDLVDENFGEEAASAGPESQENTPPQQESPAAVGESIAAESQEQPAGKDKPVVDYDKQKKKIDAILENCRKKLTNELSALVGSDIEFVSSKNRIVDKKVFFQEEVDGKQIVADMDIVGDRQGKSHIFFPVKTAIQLGGVLIMLPASELESVVAGDDLSDDIGDAFSEVANIASGVYTAVFDEQYNEKLRFIKTGFQPVRPSEIQLDSDLPIANQQYYMSKMEIKVGGTAWGNVHMLIPASLLLLETAAAEPQKTEPPVEKSAAPESKAQTPPKATPLPRSNADFEKQKKQIDTVLAECCKRMQSEISSLLGANVTLKRLENRPIIKENFFSQETTQKQVMATFNVTGDAEEKSYLFCSLKDSIYIGGVLIMLPPSELEVVVAEEEFNSDTKDAYSEVTNIIAGVYTAIFEDQYTKKLRFIKSAIDQVVPAKVDIPSDSPVPDIPFYLSKMILSIDDRELGALQLLFPAHLFGMEQAGLAEAADDAASHQDEPRQNIDVLLISDDDQQADCISAIIRAKGLTPHRIGFKDNIYNYLPGKIKAIYLVMREVNEQAFGVAIKIRVTCSLPVVAAGPGWTRSKVIKAVKYGISDILLTPASDRDIEENLGSAVIRKAA